MTFKILVLSLLFIACELLFAMPVASRAFSGAAAPSTATRHTPGNKSPQFLSSGQRAGQAGYVHYFVITAPDGEAEMQIGIEMPDGRIAWSLLNYGVTVSEFVAAGAITVDGQSYRLEHRYGVRPFHDPKTMEAFQRALPKRIAQWVNADVPYCAEELPTDLGCVSCLGFVARVLYPGRVFSALPVLPPDFKSARRNLYTTEDLLMYLTRVPIETTREARLRRINGLGAPEALREELVRLAQDVDGVTPETGKRRAASLPKRVQPRRRS